MSNHASRHIILLPAFSAAALSCVFSVSPPVSMAPPPPPPPPPPSNS